MDIIEHTENYLSELKKSIDALPREKIRRITEILLDAHKRGAKVIIMGNGGSAATASHMVCDLGKGTAVEGVPRIRAVALNDNVPLLTAWSNDTEYQYAYMEQLANLLEEGDVVIGISGSGNSPNVLNAIQYANEHGGITVGFTGFQGGKLAAMCRECIVVPSDNMERIEDIHLILEHLIKLYIRDCFAKMGAPTE